MHRPIVRNKSRRVIEQEKKAKKRFKERSEAETGARLTGKATVESNFDVPINQ